jgi:hypothetical protein
MAEPQEVELETHWIKTDVAAAMRAAANEEAVRRYAECLDRLPPGDVFYDGDQYWLADGRHRLLAHELKGLTKARVRLHLGSRRDATLFAAAANAKQHALPRTQKDARLAVRALLSDPEWAQWVDREIARHCNVSADTVGDVRRKMAEEDPGSVPPLDAQRKYKTGGTTRTMRPRGAGKKADNGEAPPADVPPTSTQEMRDQIGQVIPERLRDVFADPFLKDTARQLRALENTVKDTAARWAKHLRLSDNGHHRGILHALEEAYEGLEDGIPYAVHTRCGGKGCHGKATGCQGTGYVTQRLYEHMRNEGDW